MNLYSLDAINELIDRYQRNGGEIFEIEEGVLGHGKLVLFGHKLKTAIVTERYVNEWSSGHSVRFYNETPKKYRKYTGEEIWK